MNVWSKRNAISVLVGIVALTCMVSLKAQTPAAAGQYVGGQQGAQDPKTQVPQNSDSPEPLAPEPIPINVNPCPQTAQSIVDRPIDPTPFERPAPVALVKGQRSVVLQDVTKALAALGFGTVSSNLDTGEVRLSRVDTTHKGGRDDVLVWTDGQAGDAAVIRVYAQYAHFEDVMGYQQPQRIGIRPEEFQQRFGMVQEKISGL